MALDPQAELAKRKAWFFECQLRRINIDAFRSVSEGTPRDALLDLFSEPLLTMGFPAGQIGGRMKNLGTVYLDSQQPVWTPDERARRDAFSETLTGKMCNWLEFKEPRRIAETVADVKKTFDESRFSSTSDLPPEINRFWRMPAFSDGGWDDMQSGDVAHAISRASIAEAKPWLIPELYQAIHEDSGPPINFVDNLEQFVRHAESELQIAVGGTAGNELPSNPSTPEAYRSLIHFLLDASTTRDARESVKVNVLDKNRNADGKGFTYQYNLKVQTNGYPLGPATDYPHSFKVKYWARVVRSSLKEVYLNKDNSDMGLCLLIRLLYLYGTLPASMGDGQELPWRKRSPPDATFDAFFDRRASEDGFKNDPGLLERLQRSQARLRILLEESAAVPRSAALTFSPIVQEILRAGLHSYKFWLDEAMRANGNSSLNKARADVGVGTADREMEYWSENHYIMFASSEYLAGQLWTKDAFQPGKEFLEPGSTLGVLTGEARRDRGKARVLKWLNNRLMFGWTEFNSSGYYREHLWAVLNLVDFALDKDVREKAAIVADLLLFDVIRFGHRGVVGAAGGRSQFKSKVSGWDGALGDVVELLLGNRGVFFEGNALIAASLATSTYKVPDVLLEIGTTPPAEGFVDRSRVSIGFDESPKYGISSTKPSDALDSLRDGYAPKLRKYFPFIDSVNSEIERTHPGMSAADDDVVFWWGTSAFYNRQIVRGTLDRIDKWGLQQTGVFKGFVRFLIDDLLPLIKRAKSSFLGGLFAGPAGLIAGAFSSEDALEEGVAEDLAPFLDGSTRTRANILTYRSPDAMLSSLQNFRVRQLNYQSNVCQATLSSAISVFPTAGFAGLDISNLFFIQTGALAGAALGAGAVGGAVAGVVVNEAVVDQKNPFTDDEKDGPSWWTGYWSLPMIVQHRSAAVIVSDFDEVQEFLAEVGSHIWFPKLGFDKVDEVRSSAYDDDNFFLLDIDNIGPKGFWLFGKVMHPQTGVPVADWPEGYIGVFSNQRPEWLDRDNDAEIYEPQFEKTVEDKIEELEDQIDDALDDLEDFELTDDVDIGYVGRQAIEFVLNGALSGTYTPNINREEWIRKAQDRVAEARSAVVQRVVDKVKALVPPSVDLRNLQRIWKEPLPYNYFADLDWYVEGKNIWIVQIGSKAEFGSYEAFKDRVSRAKVTIDDNGDMECTYHMPLPGGGSESITVDYEDGGSFSVNGAPFQTDHYPRFENPFLRSGRAEWGQRDYVIEYRGKALLHDFSDFANPRRTETVETQPGEADLVKALVLFQRTGDEEMEEFTIGTATVRIGCQTATDDQVIAAGPIDEDTDHDVEWVFFDRPLTCTPDLTMALSHRAIGDGDDEAEWKVSFTVKALMGDHTLRDCALSFSGVSFDEDHRITGPLPFSITLSKWRAWEKVSDSSQTQQWLVADRRPWNTVYYDYCDVFAFDRERRLAQRRLDACLTPSPWTSLPRDGGPSFDGSSSSLAISVWPQNLLFLATSGSALFATWLDASSSWTRWQRFEPWVYPVNIFGIPDTGAAPMPVTPAAVSPLFASLSTLSQAGVEMYFAGTDGHLYGHLDWRPWSGEPGQKVEVSGFTLAPRGDCHVAGDRLFVMATNGTLWSAVVNRTALQLSPTWTALSPPWLTIRRVSIAQDQGACHVVVTAVDGSVWTTTLMPEQEPVWTPLGQPAGSPVPAEARVACAIPYAGRLDLVAVGSDGVVYITTREDTGGWNGWQSLVEGAQEFAAAAHSPAVVHRVNRQIELFIQSRNGDIFRSWWS
jgi:hypothetical protein